MAAVESQQKMPINNEIAAVRPKQPTVGAAHRIGKIRADQSLRHKSGLAPRYGHPTEKAQLETTTLESIQRARVIAPLTL